MFEALLERIGLRARERAAARRRALAQRLAAELPDGIAVEDDPDGPAAGGAGGVRLSGRALSRRFALEPRLRWMILGLVK